MTARNLILSCDGQEEQFTDMRQASLAFGRALNKPHQQVILREVTLYGTVTIAQLIRGEEQLPGAHNRPCVVCGMTHGPAGYHEYETTGARLLLQHEHDNHSQCHLGADCRKEGGNECG